MKNNMELNDLSSVIINCAFTVSNRLGAGFLEKVYENAMVIELKKQNFKVEQQYPINVFYDDINVGNYIADLFVENLIIVELKTVKSIESIHQAQMLNYLKATGVKIGLLFNFAKPKVEVKRMVNNL